MQLRSFDAQRHRLILGQFEDSKEVIDVDGEKVLRVDFHPVGDFHGRQVWVVQGHTRRPAPADSKRNLRSLDQFFTGRPMRSIMPVGIRGIAGIERRKDRRMSRRSLTRTIMPPAGLTRGRTLRG